MLRNRQFAPLIVFIKAGSPDSVRKLHQNVVMQSTTRNKLTVSEVRSAVLMALAEFKILNNSIAAFNQLPSAARQLVKWLKVLCQLLYAVLYSALHM